MCAGDRERVERMESAKADQTDGAGPEGQHARPGGAANRTVPGRAMNSFSPADEEKFRGVRRMKLMATGLLLFVAVVYVLAKWAGNSGAGAWTGYVAAAAEAGMVGALADWFAVTALFRHPLGIPIPHTAIIPTKKDQLGVSLGEFVGENFLSRDVVRQRLRAVGIGSRLGTWLADPEHADRVTAELATALRGALAVLRDSDVQAVVGEAINRRADAQEIAPGIGKMLEKVVADGGHRRVVDLICVRAHDWLVFHNDQVMDAVQGGAPAGPRGSSTSGSVSASTRNCCASSPRCATCPPTRRAAPSTASSPTSPPTSSPTPTPAPGWRTSSGRSSAAARSRT